MNRDKIKTLMAKMSELKFLTPWPELNVLQTFARVFGGVVFLYYAARLWNWNALFGNQAFIPKNFILEIYPEVVRPWFYIFPDSDLLALVMYLSMMALLLVSAFRPIPTALKILAWIIHLIFFNRNIPAVYGGDLILNALYIYYIFSEVKNKNIYNMLLWSAKIQILVVYLVSALAKLTGRTWIEGSAIGLVLQNEQMMGMSFNLLAISPLLSALLSWWVLFFELGAPFGFLVKKTKPYWIWTGVLLHISIAIMMGLWFFSMKMLMTYIFFRPDKQSPK